jgi:signal peptidase
MIRIGTRATMVLAVVLAGICLGALVLVPLAQGWVPLTILTGSMTPAIPAGSQVVVERVQGKEDAERLQLGDVVTFMPYPENLTLVTHRIVGRSVSTDGVIFTTKGDANDTGDPWQVTETQLRGKVLYHVPYAGYVADLLSPGQKVLGRQIAGGALVLYAATLIVRPLLRRPRNAAPTGGAALEQK